MLRIVSQLQGLRETEHALLTSGNGFPLPSPHGNRSTEATLCFNLPSNLGNLTCSTLRASKNSKATPRPPHPIQQSRLPPRSQRAARSLPQLPSQSIRLASSLIKPGTNLTPNFNDMDR
ncbi:hypothetical protein Droror1_Dr00025083 [Drosera rotundifolia]